VPGYDSREAEMLKRLSALDLLDLLDPLDLLMFLAQASTGVAVRPEKDRWNRVSLEI
jgi:hypothetical protein